MRPPRCQRMAGHPRLASRIVHVRPAPVAAASFRRPLHVVADLSARGRAILPKSIGVQRIMGEGSFGQVFEGSLTTPAGNQRVVLKRVKTKVQGAEAMSQMEHLLNVYASRVARGHCADFLGYCEVADTEATSRLTPGLWLVWKYEGSKTLSYYLRRRDTMRALAIDLEVPESVVLPTVMKHIFEGLAAFHAAGLVHRDIKPLNMILADDVRRFKLIDLGACADLRTGTNYVPEESILDLNFCPPEQYVMPTDSPHIAKQAGFLKLAISPMLWAKHKPDRFDTWSAGIVMLQLAVPAMRTDRALRSFNLAYGPKYKYDLAAWRKATHLPVRDCEFLDANDGLGWDMLQSLLAPRHIQVDDNGGVSFVNDTPFQRMSAYEALKHKYIKSALEVTQVTASTSGSGVGSGASSRGSLSSYDAPAVPRKGKAGSGAASAQQVNGNTQPAASSAPPTEALNSALGIWRDMSGRLFDLEARIMRQTSATELQTTTVRRLKEQLDSGRTDPVVLQREEKVLNKMQARLAGLQQDFASTANQASGIFSFFGLGGSKPQEQQAQPQPQSAGPKAVPGFRGSADRGKSSAQPESGLPSTSGGTASTMPTVSSAAGMFTSVWERLSNRLGDLEEKISNQASATERQSLVVRGLRAKVRAGEADSEMLDKAERTLSRMERRLLELDRDYRVAKQNAKGALAGNVSTDDGGKQRTGSREQSAAGVAEAVAAAEAALQTGLDNESSGSFWSRLLGAPGRSVSGSSGSSMDGSSKEASLKAAQSGSEPQQKEPQRPDRSLSPFFRRSSSPTAVKVQQQQQQPQSSQQAQAPVYRSIFGSFGGSNSNSTADLSARPSSLTGVPPAATAVAATAAAAAPTAAAPTPPSKGTQPRAASPRSGGFLGGLFGRSRQPQQQAAAQLPPPVRAPVPSQKSSTAPAAAEAAPPSGPMVPPPAAPASAGGGDALVDGASRVIRSSLGFTGLAAKIAGDMATAFKADAERYFKDLEVQEANKRQQRTLDLAFVALLREAKPPVCSTTSYAEAAERFSGEASWEALTHDTHRRELFAKYLLSTKQVEEQAVVAAEAGYRAALRRYNVAATSKWDEFRAGLPEVDPTLSAVKDPARRQQLFLEVVAELQLQANLQAASQKAELEFTALLADLREPPVTSTSTWALVRRAVAADPRCQALPERRRRELFEAFAARLLQDEAETWQPQEEQVVAAESVVLAAPLAQPEDAMAHAEDAVAAGATDIILSVSGPLQTAPVPVMAAPVISELHTDPVQPPSAAVLAADEAGIPVAAAALEEDELSAALAGMEAALETAMKAVSSPPVPSSMPLGTGGGNNVVSVSSAQFHAAAPVNGVAKKTPASPGAVATAGEGIRLEELRREQARLRSEYEAMASRLREMEERLKSQAQFMTTADEPVVMLSLDGKAGNGGVGSSGLSHSDAGSSGITPSGAEVAHSESGSSVFVHSDAGSSGLAHSTAGMALSSASSNGLTHSDAGVGVARSDNDASSGSETYLPARGQRWR